MSDYMGLMGKSTSSKLHAKFTDHEVSLSYCRPPPPHCRPPPEEVQWC